MPDRAAYDKMRMTRHKNRVAERLSRTVAASERGDWLGAKFWGSRLADALAGLHEAKEEIASRRAQATGGPGSEGHIARPAEDTTE